MWQKSLVLDAIIFITYMYKYYLISLQQNKTHCTLVSLKASIFIAKSTPIFTLDYLKQFYEYNVLEVT